MTFKALLWRVTRACIKTQHSVFVTRALMINSPISRGREDWIKEDQGCCWIWITGKKLSDILPNMNCKPISVRVTLIEMFLRAWSWVWIKTFLDWSTNHHIHYSEVTDKYIYHSVKTSISETMTILVIGHIHFHLNVVNSMYSLGCLQVGELVLLHPNWVVGLNFKGV